VALSAFVFRHNGEWLYLRSHWRLYSGNHQDGDRHLVRQPFARAVNDVVESLERAILALFAVLNLVTGGPGWHLFVG
jgi:hypothetical protein